VKDLEAFRPGSSIDALTVPKPFNHYVFVDIDAGCTAALRERAQPAAPEHANVHVLTGDANGAATHDEILKLVPRNALVVLYADPAGLDLNFDTLRFFAERYEHLDLLLNFPVPGALRALGAGQEAKASRVLNHPAPIELIGPTSGRPGVSLRDWFQRQLGTLGYREFAAEQIRLHSKNVPLYDLMLASRKPRARQFFEEAQKRGPGGQYRMDLGC
jgi:three-Cys-motif partner protein